MKTYYVYVARDSSGRAIYAGSTADVIIRMRQHASDSWWADQVASVDEAEVGASRDAARKAEMATIKALHPRWNIHWLRPRHLWSCDNYLDYVTAKSQRSTWGYRHSRSQLGRMIREYRVWHGGDLRTDLSLRGDLTPEQIDIAFAPEFANARLIPLAPPPSSTA